MRFIIDFKNDAQQVDIDAFFAQNSCTIVKTYSAFDKVYLVDSPSTLIANDIVESIVDDLASTINLLSTMTWSTSLMDDWWKISSATKPDLLASDIQYDRPTVNSIVYLVDSGIDTTHPEFANARVSSLFSFNGDNYDYNGHGTALASVIVGAQCGIVDAQVKSANIFQDGTPTLLSDLLSALDAVYVDGQNNASSIRIVNLSWAIAKNEYVESKIQLMIDSGFVVVASAGNNGTPIQSVTPASMRDVITVGAYNSDFEPCDFSNYTGYLQTTEGPVNYGELDVWAPGQDIKVAHLGGGSAFTAGTSVAAAVHTAAIAFNSQLLELTDGSVLSQIQNKSAVESLSSGRPGMIILSGQYEGSTTFVSRILTEKSGENGFVIPIKQNISIGRKSGQDMTGMLLISKINASSFHMSNLPDGLTFDNGYLIGSIIVNEPTVFESTLNYVDHSGLVNERAIRFVIVPENTEITSELSQQLGITLNDPFLPCNGSNCDGFCGTFTPDCINCGLVKLPQCVCTNIVVGCP